ncbi:single-stranded DNA-binding protein [Sphingomonas sp. SRS2]|uniref:single-stranded DNA-binding protein n=1 Tax=Sphingomonas sp. SRS2 TaxID=133190 RepID=UPI000618433B|nr:single-stranded DNA-binding protein [Sphingomonas sp. SRS2]KKC24919.1 hypothetical protein WP12_16995 [Sphingomonas sp. SRS2]
MSALRNHVRLCGSLGQDAVKRDFAAGGSVVNLRVATTERWTDRATGEAKESTDWHNVAVFTDRDVERARDLRKGDWIEVDGKLQSRKYQKSGVDHWVTEVVVRGPDHRLLVLPKRQPGRHDAPPAETPAAPATSEGSGQEGTAAQPPGAVDDYVPF